MNDDLPLVQDDDTIGVPGRVLALVRADHDGHTQVLIEVAEHRKDLLCTDRVQLRGRLVQHQDRGTHHQAGRDHQPLLLPAREMGGRSLHKLLQSHDLKRPLNPFGHLLPRDAQVLGRKGCLRAYVGREELRLGVLEYHAHVLRHLVDVVAARVQAHHLCPAPHLATEHVGDNPVQEDTERRLPGSVASHDDQVFALLHIQAHVLERRRILLRIGVGHILDRDRNFYRFLRHPAVSLFNSQPSCSNSFAPA